MTDEQLIAAFPVGYRHSLLAIALAKRLLKEPDVKADEQLQLLEQLNELADGRVITPAMLAVVEPMSDAEFDLFDAAEADDSDELRLQPSFDRVTCERGFNLFLKLNPSLLTAIRLSRPKAATARPQAQAVAPAPIDASPLEAAAPPRRIIPYLETPEEFTRKPAFAPFAGPGMVPRPKERPAW